MKRLFILFALSSLLVISCEGYDTDDGGNGGNIDNGGNITDMQKKSISGSRIVFREYELADGAIYYENTPFDTEYNRVCYFNYGLFHGLEDCCVSTGGYGYRDSVITYRDEACTDRIDVRYYGGTPVTVGDMVYYPKPNSDSCSTAQSYQLATVKEIIDPELLYVKTDFGSCEPYLLEPTCTTYFTVKELTTDEARSLFVCAK